jgi:hypothetical protein
MIYPTEVGTAITGESTSPATTLGSAPSMPAATMTCANQKTENENENKKHKKNENKVRQYAAGVV